MIGGEREIQTLHHSVIHSAVHTIPGIGKHCTHTPMNSIVAQTISGDIFFHFAKENHV